MPRFFRTARSAEDQFAAEIIALVREVHGLKASRRDDFALQIEQPGGLLVTMNLDNIYAEARALDGAARQTRLRTAVLAAVPAPRPASWREAEPVLLPAVRTPSWVAAAEPTPRLRGWWAGRSRRLSGCCAPSTRRTRSRSRPAQTWPPGASRTSRRCGPRRPTWRAGAARRSPAGR